MGRKLNIAGSILCFLGLAVQFFSGRNSLSSQKLTQTVNRELVLQEYLKYKDRVNYKISNETVRYGKACPKRKVYLGEFGYELQGIVPWYYDEHVNLKCDVNVEGVRGTRYLYWFANSFELVNEKRHFEHLPRDCPLGKDPHVTQLPTTNWTMPPMRDFFGSAHLNTTGWFPSEKPLLIIYNKYAREWGEPPINFLDVDTLRYLFKILTPNYQIIYNRMEEKKLSDHNQAIGMLFNRLKDKKLIDKEYPEVVKFEDIYDSDRMDYNLLQFGLASQAKIFISVQGGNSVVASLWGGKNFIYAVRGHEVELNEYQHWYGQLGNCSIFSTGNKTEFITTIESET